jgi:hypothetical protein
VNALATIPRIGAAWREHGGIFLGIVAGAEGQPDYLLILGPEAAGPFTHTHALKWARSLSYLGFTDWDLPNRNDSAVAYGNARAKFNRDWYWLSGLHGENDDGAWFQSFNTCNQGYERKSYLFRVRAVRRVAIK